MRKSLLLIVAVINLSGCALFFPYDEDPKCPAGKNFGRCVNSMEAYHAIASGVSQKENQSPDTDNVVRESAKDSDTGVGHRKRKAPGKISVDTQDNQFDQTAERNVSEPFPDSGYKAYVDANYRQTARLLDQPVTPLVKGTEVLEILIMPRSSDDRRVLFGQRYVHVIVETPQFILGDYLKVKKIPLNSHF